MDARNLLVTPYNNPMNTNPLHKLLLTLTIILSIQAQAQEELSSAVTEADIEQIDKILGTHCALAIIVSGAAEEGGEAVGASIPILGPILAKGEEGILAGCTAMQIAINAEMENHMIKTTNRLAKQTKEEKEIITIQKRSLELLNTLYNTYETILMYAEEVSEIIKESIIIKQISEDIREIVDIYAVYGYHIEINSLYDFEKILSPRHQQYYRSKMLKNVERAERIVSEAKKVISNKKEGGYVANDNWRMVKLREMHIDLRSILFDMKMTELTAMYYINKYKNNQATITIKESLFNHETYSHLY